MKIALFIPCYINQFYPRVGIATLELLEKLGCTVEYPLNQTCCGQPLANNGMEQEALPVYNHMVEVFKEYSTIVVPSGSCAHHVKHHYDIMEQSEDVTNLRNRIYDLTEFLVEVLQLQELNAQFKYKVGLHQSCHGLRGARTASSSELMIEPFSKWKYLLNLVEGIELISPDREDECCGFGGTFSVKEERVSVLMGRDRIEDHIRNGAEFITSGDMSCLMHMEGIIKRNKLDIEVIHLAEILNRF